MLSSWRRILSNAAHRAQEKCFGDYYPNLLLLFLIDTVYALLILLFLTFSPPAQYYPAFVLFLWLLHTAKYLPDPATGAVVLPISLSTTFAQDGVGNHKGYRVLALGQPDPLRARSAGRVTRAGAARPRVRQRPGRRGQHPAAAPSAGQAHPARQRRLRRHVPADRQGVEPARVPVVGRRPHRPRHAARRLARRHGMVWLETPTNPLLTCFDIEAIATIAHGAARSSWSTTRSPRRTSSSRSTRCRPRRALRHQVPRRPQRRCRRLRRRRRRRAGRTAPVHPERGRRIPAPFDCYLVLRGVKTLAVRMDRHCGTPAPSSTCSSAIRPSSGCCTHNSPTTPATLPRPSRCGLRWDGFFTVKPRRERCRDACRRPPRSSRSPSRSAPSRASSSTRRDDPHVGGRFAPRGTRQPGPPVGRHRGRPTSSPTRRALDSI